MPYGEELATWLYWPMRFKRMTTAEWVLFLEKFAAPTVVGRYPAGGAATREQIDALLAAARDVRRDTAAVIPEGMTLELLEASRSGQVEFGSLAAMMDATIAKTILGQTMTTDDGSSRSQAEVHERMRLQIIKSDATSSARISIVTRWRGLPRGTAARRCASGGVWSGARISTTG